MEPYLLFWIGALYVERWLTEVDYFSWKRCNPWNLKLDYCQENALPDADVVKMHVLPRFTTMLTECVNIFY